MRQGIDLLHDDLRLVRSVVGLGAADWVGGAGVDAKLEAQDGVAGSVLVETIPTVLDDRTNLSVDDRVDVVADAKPRKELRHVTVG